MMKKLFKMFLWLVGLVLVLGLGLMAYFFIMGRDITPADDSDLRIVESPVPDSKNTYVAFLAVTNLEMLTQEDARICAAFRQWRRDVVTNKLVGTCGVDVEAVRSQVDRVLLENAPYFEGLHRAVALPGYRFTKADGELDWMACPSFTKMLRANMLWQTKEMREVDKRDYAAALETFRDHLAFGGKIGVDAANCVHLLVGLGIACSAYESARALSVCEGVPEDVLTALADMVRDEIDMRSAFVRAVKCEYMRISDALRDNEIALEQLLLVLPCEFSTPRWYWRVSGYKRFSLLPGVTRQLYADACRQMLKGEGMETVVSKPVLGVSPNWAGRQLVLANTFVTKDVEKGIKKRLLQARFTRVMIAAQRYQNRQGAFPKSLEELVPQYLEVVPRDPFAPDRTIQYDCARCMVWSVGKDGNFDPFAAKKDYKFNRNMSMYALRFDGEPPVPRRTKKWQNVK